MKEIKKVAIIGTGALGMMYGAQIMRHADRETVTFVLDEARYESYQGRTFTCNGEVLNLHFERSGDMTPVDLVMVAVKYNSLSSALETMKHCVGEDTIIMSVMNGIDSEEIIGARYGAQKLIDTVAQGMDAMRDGSTLRYTQMGWLCIGASGVQSQENLAAVCAFFDAIRMPYQKEENIRYRMWAKWMLNVGINQTCMAYDTTYACALVEGSEENRMFVSAMEEVIALSRLEGINLKDSEIDFYVGLVSKLDPDGYPSMAQDRKAGRKTEVEMFAGTVLKMARKYGINAPANAKLYQMVKDYERALA